MPETGIIELVFEFPAQKFLTRKNVCDKLTRQYALVLALAVLMP